jgi:hypothetical protein
MPSNIDSSPHTPERYSKRREYDTIRKTRFYNAFDSKRIDDPLGQIYKRSDINISPSTAKTWLRKREIIGSPAYRKIRKTSKRLGRKYILSTPIFDDLLRHDHPLNCKFYATQVKELNLPIK